MRAAVLLIGLATLALPGCGDDKHEALLDRSAALVTAETLDSAPTGAPLPRPGMPMPGDRWVATIEVEEHVEQVRGDQIVEDRDLRGTWTIAETFAEQGSEASFRFVQSTGAVHVEGAAPQLQVTPPRAGAHVDQLDFDAPRAEEVDLLRPLVQGLELAGFAGSPSWLPARDLREGEAWDMLPLMHPSSLARMRSPRSMEGIGKEIPTVTGQARVEEVLRDEGGSPVALRVRMEVGLQLDTTITQGDQRAPLQTRHRLQGEATLSLATGLPTKLDIAYVERISYLDVVFVQERRMTGTVASSP